MPDVEKVSYGLRCICYGDVECKECPYAKDGSGWYDCKSNCAKDALELLKEQQSTLGIVQTANSITFTSTGDAKKGEERGLMLGKEYMREHIEKELLYKHLLTDEIRKVIKGID